MASAARTFGMLAVVFGVAGAAYVTGSQPGKVQQQTERSRVFVPEFNVVEIPVPQRPVPVGMAVRDIPVRYEKFPEHQLPGGVVRDLGKVRELVATVSLPGGLPIMDSNLGSVDESSNPMVGRIPPGMRAMTVRVDATTAVEGWARSGSVVDVLLVQNDRTTVVAEQVRVLSTERSLSPVEEQGQATIPSTVTLLVTQEQCLAVNTAVPLGKIALVLRSNGDDERWRSTSFSARELSSGEGGAVTSRVQGVAWFGTGAERKQYALVNGAWIPSQALPAGFTAPQPADRQEER
jgi:pilus assembly protein CpaB